MIAAALLACAISADHSTDVHPETMKKIIMGESGGNPYAVNVNRYSGPQPHPTNKEEAIAVAQRFIAAGYSVDLGEAQINSKNLDGLGYTLSDAFDDCTNVRGGGTILTSFYRKAAEKYGPGQQAALAAISAYNTGSFYRGFENGYVARIIGIPDVPIPDFPRVAAAQRPKAVTPRLPIDPYTASTAVYERASYHVPIE